MGKYKAIVFDFDGTLVDDIKIIIHIERKLNKKYHNEILKREDLNFERKSSMFKRLKVKLLSLPFFYADFRRELENNFINLDFYDGIREVLEKINKGDMICGVLTSNIVHKPIDNLNKYFDKKDINVFDFVSHASLLIGKSRYLSKILKKYKLDPKEVLYIGDEVTDVEACKYVGIDIAACSWGFTKREVLEKYTPNFIVDHPKDILKLLH